MENKISLRKIARELGVSHTTVSLVLNEPDTNHVSKEKRKKILAYVREIGYRVPAKKKATGNIGFLIGPHFDISNPYHHRFFVGIEEASIKSGKNIILETWRNSSSPLFWNNKVDGVIIAEDRLTEGDIRQIQKYVPVVLLNWSPESVICDMVVPDNTGGVREAFAYLYKLGHRRIGFFALVPQKLGISSDRRFKERLQGYYMGLEDYKLPMNKEYLQLPLCRKRDINEVEEQVSQTLKKWKSLPNPPTAVITYNDIYGVAFIKKAPSIGINIPRDLSVIGFDNTIACHYVSPSLSSIDQAMEAMGKLSMELLEERIKEGNKSPFKKLTCGTELVIRESVGKVNPGECRGKKEVRDDGKDS